MREKVEKNNLLTYKILKWVLEIRYFHTLSLREASHIDFVHEKRHMDVGEGGGTCDISR